MRSERVYSLRWRIPFPRSIAGLWVFAIGAILLVILGVQILTGIVLAMFYVPTAELAFDSIIHIMRAVRHGELLRNMHAIGASLFFFASFCAEVTFRRAISTGAEWSICSPRSIESAGV